MRILGITDGQTSGAAIVEDGRILAAINEERIVRKKMARGFPWASISEVLKLSNTDPSEVSGVAVAQVNMELREEVVDWPGWFEARDEEVDVHSFFFRAASRFGSLAPKIPALKSAYYALRAPTFRQRRKRIGEILKNDFGVGAEPQFYKHHFAHATSAYYTSPFDECLVITMDGGGDGHCSHVYRASKGRLEHLQTIDSYDSLGNFYAYVTAVCGFKAKRHEGKITGLAASGVPVYREMLNELIEYRDGRFINKGQILFNTALDRIKSGLPTDWKREDLASSIQLLSEEAIKCFVAYWQAKTGIRKVALAGGLFANVRINQEVLEVDGVDEIFVHPAMSDEGLAVGAALALDRSAMNQAGEPYEPLPLDHVYLGNDYSDSEISSAIENAGLRAEYLPGCAEERIAEILHNRKVVARFNGKMEYGPRALGNRSILYHPGDPEVNVWLNENLNRSEFMPFAPACVEEEADSLFENLAGGKNAARFMTVTFRCKQRARDLCSGTVHIDNTARPQVVRAEDNPSYYRIISEYGKLSGVSCVINTSFNVHEEPIVRSPEDAIRAFVDSQLDYLAIGDFIVTT